MLDLLNPDMLTKSPTAQRFFARIMAELKKSYNNDSELGAAMRELINNLRSPSSEIYNECGMQFAQKSQMAAMVNMAHQTLKENSNG